MIDMKMSSHIVPMNHTIPPDAQESEIEHLDCSVFSLPPMLHAFVILRFYEKLSLREVQNSLQKDP